MEGHSSNSLGYYLSLPLKQKNYLGAIRHWQNLKVAFEADVIWVKDFNAVQLDSLEVKTIPYKQLYYSSGPQLFLKGSLLPERIIPSLLWTPIERGLPVELPAFNHNFFGVHDAATIRLKKTDQEKESTGLLVDLTQLGNYIQTSPAVRLQNLSWVIVDEEKAFVIGTPMLPIQGETFWNEYSFFFPTGYRLEFGLLMQTIENKLNSEGVCYTIWDQHGSYWQLSTTDLTPLSISSFRASINFQHVRT